MVRERGESGKLKFGKLKPEMGGEGDHPQINAD
jgi:hypothetical protein